MKPNPNEPDLKGFLRDLNRISKKHGLIIGGSGDLGSPWIAPLKDGKILMEHFHYCPVHERYDDYESHWDCE
ncbi:hypothetical protein ABT282_08155 [Streptomyces sp. NPDC000927]|uniref:hypothetical protein n=1 Tax=Streptomyces sp. NPDC000927 TaxID=3154371 RepID=UPI0033172012